MLENIRKELGEKYINQGLTKEVIKLSQQLDQLILREQLKINVRAV